MFPYKTDFLITVLTVLNNMKDDVLFCQKKLLSSTYMSADFDKIVYKIKSIFCEASRQPWFRFFCGGRKFDIVFIFLNLLVL